MLPNYVPTHSDERSKVQLWRKFVPSIELGRFRLNCASKKDPSRCIVSRKQLIDPSFVSLGAKLETMINWFDLL